MSYLIDLRKDVNQISGFLDVLNNFDIEEVCQGYIKLRDVEAPIRTNPYFMGTHGGIPSSGESSTRGEDHLAMALFNASQDGKVFELPDKQSIKFIDYQTPLKAKQSDKGIGNIDLFGVINGVIPAIIELKIDGRKGRLADTPLYALIEGFMISKYQQVDLSTIIGLSK